MITFEFNRQSTALLVHDMQDAFLNPKSSFASQEARLVLPTVKSLLADCRGLGLQVVYTQVAMRPDLRDWSLITHVLSPDACRSSFLEGTQSAQIYEEVAPTSGDIVIRKTAYSPFYGTNLEGLLRNLGINTLAICGVTTNVGCDATARDALYRGIKVVFLTDATAAHALHDVGFGEISGEDAHRVTCTIIGNYIGQLLTAREFVRRLS